MGQMVAVGLENCRERLLAARLAARRQLTAAQIEGQLGFGRRRCFGWMMALKVGGSAGLLG